MKRILLVIMVILLLTVAVINVSAAKTLPTPTPVTAEGVKVSLNGALLNFDVPPMIINSRTMVPLRAIFEALSASVDWNQETKTVVSVRENKTIKLTVDSDQMIVDDKAITLDCPATVVQDRTLVPVRAISEAFGVKVDWVPEHSLVVLREEEYAGVKTVILYNMSNQIMEVSESDAKSFTQNGWTTEKPVTMYKTDGQTKVVATKDIEANKAEGWYIYPVTTMYAADGRTVVVATSEVEAKKAEWWFEYPVTTMYATDGRTIIVAAAEESAYAQQGWYTASQYEVIKYSYLAGTDFRRIKSQYSTAVANCAYLYPFTDSNGDSCILVCVSYKLQKNWFDYFLHNISKGTVTSNPADYYKRLVDGAWGASKIQYMDLYGDVLAAQVQALKGLTGEAKAGVFVGSDQLNY